MTDSRTSTEGAQPARIFVAEDNNAMRNLLVDWLQGAEYDVTVCSSGFDLLTQLERSVLSGELPRFDVVLSDIQMQMGSALGVLDEFVGCDGVPPTILITAFEDPLAREAISQLGVAAVLEQPLERHRLLAEIQRLRGRAADETNSPARRAR